MLTGEGQRLYNNVSSYLLDELILFVVHTQTVKAYALPRRKMQHLSPYCKIVALLSSTQDPLAGRTYYFHPQIVQLESIVFCRTHDIAQLCSISGRWWFWCNWKRIFVYTSLA